MLRSETKYPLSEMDLAGTLQRAWEKGWLDEFADDHFLIKAIEGRLEHFPSRFQIPIYLALAYPITPENFQKNFCINFSGKISRLIALFGEESIYRFFTDQLSAGKNHYDEDQFFRALSEVSVLSYFAMNANSGIYEPKTNGRKNPEARLHLNNGITVDVEVKTPGFSDFRTIEHIAIPTVLLDDQGRRKFKDFCKSYGLRGELPRVMKIKDFLNSAVEKFEEVDHVQHMNILYINWSLSEFEESGFQEAFSLMAHPINGILVHKDIALSLGIQKEVFEKITAVVVYTEPLQSLMFGELRWVWVRGHDGQPQFGIIGMHKSDSLIEVTGMNPYAQQLTPIMTGIFKDTSCINEIMDFIYNHMLKPGDCHVMIMQQ